jgi:hypothetical protein
MLFVKAGGVWLVMLVAAFLNGALRELLLVRLVGEQVGHVLSVCLLSGVIFGITYLFVKAQRPLPASTLLGIWVLLAGLQPPVRIWLLSLCHARTLGEVIGRLQPLPRTTPLCGSPRCSRR